VGHLKKTVLRGASIATVEVIVEKARERGTKADHPIVSLYQEEIWEDLLGRVVGTERGTETLVDVMAESAMVHEMHTMLDGQVREEKGGWRGVPEVETEMRGANSEATNVVTVAGETIAEERDVVRRE
jgi:hypothetical protein